jgi:hypothetical protein
MRVTFKGDETMGKLALYVAMKRDLAFEFERELRAVRNLILGVTRVSGSEYTVDLYSPDSFVAGSQARAVFAECLQAAVHEALVKYAHDLAHECIEHGMDHNVVGAALGGPLMRDPGRPDAGQGMNGSPEGNGVRLAYCA